MFKVFLLYVDKVKKKAKSKKVEGEDRTEEEEEAERSSEDKARQDRETVAKMSKLLQENEQLKTKV